MAHPAPYNALDPKKMHQALRGVAFLCVVPLAFSASAQDRAVDIVDVQETVIPLLVAEFRRTTAWGEPAHFCVAVSSVEPSTQPAFAAALHDLASSFRWGSSCGEPCEVPKDYSQPQFSCVFVRVGEVRFQPDGSAQIDGSFQAGPLFGRGDAYFLRKEGSAWRINKLERKWVS